MVPPRTGKPRNVTNMSNDSIRTHYRYLRQRALATWNEYAGVCRANGFDYWPSPKGQRADARDSAAEESATIAALRQAETDYPASVRSAASVGDILPEPPARNGCIIHRCPDVDTCIAVARAAWEATHVATVAEWESYRQAVAQGVAIAPTPTA